MREYRRRIVEHEIDDLASSLPAIFLEGAKGVGKTETALRRARTTFKLDEEEVLEIAAGDSTRLVRGAKPILLDEWQRLPQSWDLVRRAVDDGASANSFLLTGSASPIAANTHSGAGRIVGVRMRPLSLVERDVDTPSVELSKLLTGGRAEVEGTTSVDLEDYAHEIVASGFPGLRSFSGRALRAQLDSYIGRIVERDFEELGTPVRNPAILRRWLSAYAAATATTSSYETIRDASTSGHGDKPAKSTTVPYRDVLEHLWIVDAVPAWLPTRNHIARLSAPPKHQLVDPALAAQLLGASKESLLNAEPTKPAIVRDGALLGHLFESLVTQSLHVYAQHSEATVKHLRTQGGDREIDLIVQRADDKVVAVEVKLARTVDDDDVRHLHWLKGRIGDDLLDAMVITTGTDAYRRKDGIAVVPAALLGP